MTAKEFSDQLKEIYTEMHAYAKHLLTDLKPEVYTWKPEGVRARSIESYFRHLVNSEEYWLYALKKQKLSYLLKEATYQDMLQKFDDLEKVYVELLTNSSTKDLEIRPTIYIEKNKGLELEIKQEGSLSWSVLRITLHALEHLGQITAIMYSLEARGDPDPVHNWMNFTEKIINIGKLVSLDS